MRCGDVRFAKAVKSLQCCFVFFFCLHLVFVMYKVCFSGWLVVKGRFFPKKSGEADKKKVEKCPHSAEKASYGVLE